MKIETLLYVLIIQTIPQVLQAPPEAVEVLLNEVYRHHIIRQCTVKNAIIERDCTIVPKIDIAVAKHTGSVFPILAIYSIQELTI